MKKNDVADMFKVICVLFPQSAKNFATADELQRDAWHRMLADEPMELVGAALEKYAATHVFAPSISELLSEIGRIKYPQSNIDPDEAWGMVIQAIRKYGYYRQEDALQSLPAVVAATVRTFGWRDLCMSENIAVDRGQFRKAYELRLSRERENAAMPQRLKQTITGIVNQFALPVQQVLPGEVEDRRQQ